LPNRAEIFLAQPITKAFALRVELTAREGPGQLEFGPYQDTGRLAGYRLLYAPGAPRGLELLRLSRFGRSVITAQGRPVNLADGRAHVVQWTREPGGEMVVWLDGEEVMRTVDRGLDAPFDGVTLLNLGSPSSISAATTGCATSRSTASADGHRRVRRGAGNPGAAAPAASPRYAEVGKTAVARRLAPWSGDAGKPEARAPLPGP
jgi:hypothetical protein